MPVSWFNSSYSGGRPAVPAVVMAALAALVILAGCAAAATPPPAKAPRLVQVIVLRVMDGHDAPVAGARVKIQAVAGRPAQPGPWRTDAAGELHLKWRPAVVNETAGLASRDRVFLIQTKLRYLVSAPGHVPAGGEIKRRDRQQTVAAPQLERLNRRASLNPVYETVVLHKYRELLGRRLARLGLGHRLVKRCLAFHRDNQVVARRLGAEMAWPTFTLKGKTLTLRLDWRGASWEGLAQAPLLARVSLSAGVPLAMVCGEELLPAPGVARLRLVFLSRTTPPNDPYAIPTLTRVVLAAPAADFLALARGKLAPARFLAQNPPRLIKGGREVRP